MYAHTSIRDAYHKFKKTYTDYLLAFGQGAFFVFVLGDADKISKTFPDIQKWNECDYSQIRIHSTQFFTLVARLKAKNMNVAMVARNVNPTNHKVSYKVTVDL